MVQCGLGAAIAVRKRVYSLEIATTRGIGSQAGRHALFPCSCELGCKGHVCPSICGVVPRAGYSAVTMVRKSLRPFADWEECAYAFLLAEAGILNGKRATSHWKFGKELANRYPQVQVESDPIWVRDGNIYTSAGISAGIDLALAWVEEDCGSALAHEIARELVLFLRRPAGQQQLSVSLAKQASAMKSIQELQVWIADHLEKNLPVEVLAQRVAMSVRNFERVFTRETGCPPARYVAQMRVEAARRQLEDTDKSIEQVARNCGFVRRPDASTFVRSVGTTPGRYRSRLSSALASLEGPANR